MSSFKSAFLFSIFFVGIALASQSTSLSVDVVKRDGQELKQAFANFSIHVLDDIANLSGRLGTAGFSFFLGTLGLAATIPKLILDGFGLWGKDAKKDLENFRYALILLVNSIQYLVEGIAKFATGISSDVYYFGRDVRAAIDPAFHKVANHTDEAKQVIDDALVKYANNTEVLRAGIPRPEVLEIFKHLGQIADAAKRDLGLAFKASIEALQNVLNQVSKKLTDGPLRQIKDTIAKLVHIVSQMIEKSKNVWHNVSEQTRKSSECITKGDCPLDLPVKKD